jgi:hypothetical protein
MTTTAYTTEELSTLAGAVMFTGMAVAIVDAGLVSTAIEANAMAKEVAGASQKYPTNTIIQSLFSEEAAKAAKEHGKAKVEINAEEMKPDTAIDTAIAKITEALAVLEGKATAEEIQQYKEFIYTCADRVANAAGSGLFGSGATKVSDTEAAALTKLKMALGL